VSRDGTLVFDSTLLQTRLAWYDRAGKPAGALGEPGVHFAPRISPDGTRVAFDLYDAGSMTEQVWVADVARGVQTRLTSGPASNSGPVWSPDGARIAFQSDRKHQADICLRALAGTGETALTDADGQRIPHDITADGHFLIALDREAVGERRVRVVAFPLAGDSQPITLVPYASDIVWDARVSPDGRWLAYDRDETGRREVYVVSFPDGQTKVQVSNAGGGRPHWTRGGKEILYTAPDGTVTAVELDAAKGLQPSMPRALFALPPGTDVAWDVTGDGEKFLLNVPVTQTTSVPLTLVQNGLPAAQRR
jgi:Tol biopolymer transport system component